MASGSSMIVEVAVVLPTLKLPAIKGGSTTVTPTLLDQSHELKEGIGSSATKARL
jgi:hypothetical protein